MAMTATGLVTVEAAQQPPPQQPPVPPAAASLQSPNATVPSLPVEAAAALEEAMEPKEEALKSEEAMTDQSLSPPHAATTTTTGSNHRVKSHLAGDAAAIALVITAGASSEAKVAQRVVNRSGQKALQGFFSDVFETITAS